MKAVQMMMMRIKAIKPRWYGYLYNFYAIDNIAATGWHVPTRTEKNTMVSYLGTSPSLQLKSTRVAPDEPYWDGATTGLNLYNFNAQAGGSRSNVGYDYLHYLFRSWTSTPYGSSAGYYFDFGDEFLYIRDVNTIKIHGMSLRLVRPLEVGEDLLSDGTYVDDYIGNDGKEYKAIKLGDLIWTAENLAETKYNDLTSIPTVTNQQTWNGLTTGAKCAYDNDENYV